MVFMIGFHVPLLHMPVVVYLCKSLTIVKVSDSKRECALLSFGRFCATSFLA